MLALPLPSYFPDFAVYEFLFRKMKMKPKEKALNVVLEIQENLPCGIFIHSLHIFCGFIATGLAFCILSPYEIPNSLFITIKLNTKYGFCVAAMLLFYILQERAVVMFLLLQKFVLLPCRCY
jgi:hypothetical protein